jgi:single-strand selective monofunctional uracil DNA glycosylase
VTPDKLPATDKKPLTEACDEHLRSVIEILEPEWCIGVGGFATKCLQRVLHAGKKSASDGPAVGTILHPSPASPAANRGWAEKATAQLEELGVW